MPSDVWLESMLEARLDVTLINCKDQYSQKTKMSVWDFRITIIGPFFFNELVNDDRLTFSKENYGMQIIIFLKEQQDYVFSAR